MTIHLTIPSSSRLPTSSSSSSHQLDLAQEEEEKNERAKEEEESNEAGLQAVSTAIRSARRIVVLSGELPRVSYTRNLKLIVLLRFTGAGISVAAGIPDFRSSTGLFQSLGGSSSQESKKAGVTSGKELFDVSALNVRRCFTESGGWGERGRRTKLTFIQPPLQSPFRSSLHHRMLASLYQLASEAEPTPFHRMLKELDNEGRLLRVYTQSKLSSIFRPASPSFPLLNSLLSGSCRHRQPRRTSRSHFWNPYPSSTTTSSTVLLEQTSEAQSSSSSSHSNPSSNTHTSLHPSSRTPYPSPLPTMPTHPPSVVQPPSPPTKLHLRRPFLAVVHRLPGVRNSRHRSRSSRHAFKRSWEDEGWRGSLWGGAS